MHVLILNQTFHPDVAATGQLMWDFARHLRAVGHSVTVITGRSFYGTDRVHSTSRETLEGIDIHRVAGTALGKRSLPARLTDFASFYLAAAVRLGEVRRPDVILALTSPPLVATLAMLRRQFAGNPPKFVYHIMDLYPDAAIGMGVVNSSSFIGRSMRRLTCRTLDTADAVVALGRDMKERLLTNYAGHARANRICVIPPWSDGAQLRPASKKTSKTAAALGLTETFNLVYSGNLGVVHDLKTMLAAIDATRNDTALRWIFIGGGKRWDELQSEINRSRWPHVKCLPFQQRDDLNDTLNMADVHLVSQLPAFTGIVVPSKLFGIMAVGKPALMIGPADCECARVISENAMGFVIPNGNPGLLLSRIELLRTDPIAAQAIGARARAAFEAKYDRLVACRRLENVLRSAVEGTANPADC